MYTETDTISKEIQIMTDETNVVEKYIRIFREKARYDVNEKRMHRFGFLQKLQTEFYQYDLQLIKDILIGLFRQVHGVEYSYDDFVLTDFPNMTDKIPVRCEKHGIFYVRIIDHLIPISSTDKYPMGCTQCITELRQQSGGYRKKNTTIFIGDAEIRHGDRFDNRYVKYVDSTSKQNREHVTFICLECQRIGESGIFQRHASDHLRNRPVGCPICHKRNWSLRSQEFLSRPDVRQKISQSRIKSGFLYYIQLTIDDKVVYKIGVSHQKMSLRMWQMCNNTNAKGEILCIRFFTSGSDARAFESKILNDERVIPFRYQIGNSCVSKGELEKLLRNGNRELFTVDIRNIVPELFEGMVTSDSCVLGKRSKLYYVRIIKDDLRMFLIGNTDGDVDEVINTLMTNNPDFIFKKTLEVHFTNALCAMSLIASLMEHPYSESRRYKTDTVLNTSGVEDTLIFYKNVLRNDEIRDAFDIAFEKNGLVVVDER